MIGSGRVMKFVVHERFNDALCGRFGEIRKGISTRVWSQNPSGIGTKGPMMNKTLIRKTSLIVSGVRKIFISKLLKNKEIVFNFDM